jgi:hypothetical protein
MLAVVFANGKDGGCGLSDEKDGAAVLQLVKMTAVV